MHQSIPQQIRTRVLNMTLGQWIRAVDLVLSEYEPQGDSVESEADHVTKLSLLMMLSRWYDEEDICLLLDSTALRLPKRLAESNRYQISKILDSSSEMGVIEDFSVPDDDAPPSRSGAKDESLRLLAEDF